MTQVSPAKPSHSRVFHGVVWLLFLMALGVATGSGCALFLWALDLVTYWRGECPWLLWGLPLAGLLVGWLSQRVGSAINAGTQTIIREIRDRRDGVPVGMAPFVLLGTLITHLCGGSAGREGTAVQIGGSLAGGVASRIPFWNDRDVRWALMCGAAAGFGGVFGTPIAGAVFALEFAALRRWEWKALLPCLIVSFWSDRVCTAWGIEHTHYVVQWYEENQELLFVRGWREFAVTIIAGFVFGGIARLFAGTTECIQGLLSRYLSHAWLRPVLGGLVVILLTGVLGTRDYLGIGVTTTTEGASLVNAFQPQGIPAWSWAWKLVFTAVTIGSGFKGGEATPLFFMGATAGHQLGIWAGVPPDWLASMGFVAVFSSATRTPLAGTVMACELFGSESLFYGMLACYVAVWVSGHGVYHAQSIPEQEDSAPDVAVDANVPLK